MNEDIEELAISAVVQGGVLKKLVEISRTHAETQATVIRAVEGLVVAIGQLKERIERLESWSQN